jgi:hypothetical protein
MFFLSKSQKTVGIVGHFGNNEKEGPGCSNRLLEKNNSDRKKMIPKQNETTVECVDREFRKEN